MSAGTEIRRFPFGVPADPRHEPQDGRGPDTMNRLLLHGARYHSRSDVFLDWEEGRRGGRAWQGTPDWRADRAAIRAALVLGQRLGVARGEAVALWLPLSRQLAAVERGCWSIGIITVPVWPEWTLGRVAQVLADAEPQVLFAPDLESLESLEVIGGLPDSVRASIVLRGPAEGAGDWLPFEKLMEYGGVLDTPERASMWRTAAREARPHHTAVWEYAGGGERRAVDHGSLVEAARALLERFPPAPGRVWALADETPEPLSRLALYAGWADGLTRLAFAGSEEAGARLPELDPELVLCPAAAAERLAERLAEPAGSPAPAAGPRPALRRLLEARRRNGHPGAGRQAGGGGRADRTRSLYFVPTDRAETDLTPRGRVRFVPRAELHPYFEPRASGGA